MIQLMTPPMTKQAIQTARQLAPAQERPEQERVELAPDQERAELAHPDQPGGAQVQGGPRDAQVQGVEQVDQAALEAPVIVQTHLLQALAAEAAEVLK